mmetsp:Transcript_36408/g.113455  ORF Transcript_36408/g.113455 Transcript_36408/m.113455 type:complete len:270 (-) Transcript_36408:164-973(-)
MCQGVDLDSSLSKCKTPRRLVKSLECQSSASITAELPSTHTTIFPSLPSCHILSVQALWTMLLGEKNRIFTPISTAFLLLRLPFACLDSSCSLCLSLSSMKCRRHCPRTCPNIRPLSKSACILQLTSTTLQPGISTTTSLSDRLLSIPSLSSPAGIRNARTPLVLSCADFNASLRSSRRCKLLRFDFKTPLRARSLRSLKGTSMSRACNSSFVWARSTVLSCFCRCLLTFSSLNGILLQGVVEAMEAVGGSGSKLQSITCMCWQCRDRS